MQNLNSLYDNIDLKLNDSEHLKSEVDEYQKALQNYK